MYQVSFWTYNSYLCVHSVIVHIHVDVIVVSIDMVPEHTVCLVTKTTELLQISQMWIPQHNLSSRLHASTSALPARALPAKLGSRYH